MTYPFPTVTTISPHLFRTGFTHGMQLYNQYYRFTDDTLDCSHWLIKYIIRLLASLLFKVLTSNGQYNVHYNISN